MPGDGLVPEPMVTITHGITIDAPPERVWPWLVQMGSLRGGWYSYDRIDNGAHPSAECILDQFQHLAPGDVVPCLPGARDAFVVAVVDPPYDLILTVPGMSSPVTSWEHLVERVAPRSSRLILRGRVSRGWKQMAREAHTVGRRPTFIEYVYRLVGRLPEAWLVAIASLGHRWMEARHMRGIKRRVEAHEHAA